jgi:hypothetical protein
LEEFRKTRKGDCDVRGSIGRSVPSARMVENRTHERRGALLPLPNEGEKQAWGNNANLFVGFDVEQMLITAHHIIGTPFDCCSQILVIVRISLNHA